MATPSPMRPKASDNSDVLALMGLRPAEGCVQSGTESRARPLPGGALEGAGALPIDDRSHGREDRTLEHGGEQDLLHRVLGLQGLGRVGMVAGAHPFPDLL